MDEQEFANVQGIPLERDSKLQKIWEENEWAGKRWAGFVSKPGLWLMNRLMEYDSFEVRSRLHSWKIDYITIVIEGIG